MGTHTHYVLMLRIYLYSLGLRSKKRYMIHNFKLNNTIIFFYLSLISLCRIYLYYEILKMKRVFFLFGSLISDFKIYKARSVGINWPQRCGCL